MNNRKNELEADSPDDIVLLSPELSPKNCLDGMAKVREVNVISGDTQGSSDLIDGEKLAVEQDAHRAFFTQLITVVTKFNELLDMENESIVIAVYDSIDKLNANLIYVDPNAEYQRAWVNIFFNFF